MANHEERGVAHPHQSSFLGIPLGGFGLFASLLLAFGSAFLAFFASTTAAIFALLAWNLSGHRAVSYAASYLWVGLPVSIAVLAIALPLLGTLWTRARMRR